MSWLSCGKDHEPAIEFIRSSLTRRMLSIVASSDVFCIQSFNTFNRPVSFVLRFSTRVFFFFLYFDALYLPASLFNCAEHNSSMITVFFVQHLRNLIFICCFPSYLLQKKTYCHPLLSCVINLIVSLVFKLSEKNI